MKFRIIIFFITSALLGATTQAATSDYDRDSDRTAVSDSSRIPVATGQYVTGGVLASTVGFGIGHAIQGRYADKGWIFTATEAGGVALIVAAASSCSEKTDYYGNKSTNCTNGALAVVGLGVLIGFHVWEIVDAWTGARPVDNGPRAFLIPNPEAPGLGLAWSF